MKRSRAVAAMLLLAAGPLCGCAVNHRAPDVTLPGSYDAPQGAAVLAPAALDRWWLQFNDPELNTLEDDAFQRSPDALTATSRILEARATRGSAVAQTLPQGEIAGNASRERQYDLSGGSSSLNPIGGTTDTQTANFNVTWELDLFGRLATKRKIASADLAATRFDVEAARASLAASVADDYFQARGYAIQLADARESVRIETELQRIASKKAELGLGAVSDADRVAGDLAQAQAQADDLESQLHAIARQLLILVGRGIAPTSSLAVEASVGDPPPIPAAMPGDLLTRRPDVRETEARLRAEAGTDKLSHLAIFPTFNLLPGLGGSRTTYPSVGYNGATGALYPEQVTTSLGMWTLAGGVNVPALDIPHLLYDAKAEDARTEQAVIAYEKAVQTAYGEAENALVNLAAGERAVAVLADGEARAHRASDAAKRRYAMGLDDLTSALSAEQSWRATRSALTSERVQALRRAVVTYKALGGGWASSATKTPQGAH